MSDKNIPTGANGGFHFTKLETQEVSGGDKRDDGGIHIYVKELPKFSDWSEAQNVKIKRSSNPDKGTKSKWAIAHLEAIPGYDAALPYMICPMCGHDDLGIVIHGTVEGDSIATAKKIEFIMKQNPYNLNPSGDELDAKIAMLEAEVNRLKGLKAKEQPAPAAPKAPETPPAAARQNSQRQTSRPSGGK